MIPSVKVPLIHNQGNFPDIPYYSKDFQYYRAFSSLQSINFPETIQFRLQSVYTIQLCNTQQLHKNIYGYLSIYQGENILQSSENVT